MPKKTRNHRFIIAIAALVTGSSLFLNSCGKGKPSSSPVSTEENQMDLSSIRFDDATFEYDGEPHEITIRGELPEGVYVRYSGNGKTDAGTYVVTATFTTDLDVGESGKELKATMTILRRKVSVPNLSFTDFPYDETAKTVEIIGLDESIMEVSGTTSATEIGDYQVTLSLKDPQNNEWATDFDGILSWSILSNDDYCNVVFYGEDGTTIIAQYYVPKGKNIDDYLPECPTKEGYHSNWEYGGILIEEDLYVHVIFEAIPYSICYELNGGEYDGVNSYTIEDEDIVLGTPTKPYSSFLGWYTDSAFQNRIEKISHGSKGDLILYAKFESSLNISYYDGETMLSTMVVDYGFNFTLPDSYEKDGQSLVAWVIQDKRYTPGKTYRYLFQESVRAEALFSMVNKEVRISPSVEDDTAKVIGLSDPDTTDLVITEYVRSTDEKYYRATSIGSWAFANNTALASISMPDSIEVLDACAFQNATALAQLNFSQNITDIETACFTGCSSLTHIELPEGVHEIKNSLFQGCTKLEDITFSSELVSIADSAFQGTALKQLTLPTGFTTLGSAVFVGCQKLTDVVLPSSLTTIGSGCFDGCTTLTGISYQGTMAQWNQITFGSGWQGNVSVIHCSDGDVSLNS